MAATLEQRMDEIETKFSARIAELECQISHLSEQINISSSSEETPWWKKIVGVFKDDPEFDEAMRLGREYRDSQRLKDDGVFF